MRKWDCLPCWQSYDPLKRSLCFLKFSQGWVKEPWQRTLYQLTITTILLQAKQPPNSVYNTEHLLMHLELDGSADLGGAHSVSWSWMSVGWSRLTSAGAVGWLGSAPQVVQRWHAIMQKEGFKFLLGTHQAISHWLNHITWLSPELMVGQNVCQWVSTASCMAKGCGIREG